MLAGGLGLALVVMPLLILSYDPNVKLERLHQPLCDASLVVEATNSNGGHALTTPTSGLHVNATRSGAPVSVTLNVFTRDAGGSWALTYTVDATTGSTDYFLPSVKSGEELYARAIDPTSKLCPADSPTIRAA